MAKTILFLAANPLDTDQLRLGREIEDIKEEIQRSRKRNKYELSQKLAVRPQDLHRAFLDYNPEIVHFAGHGAGKYGIILENEQGEAHVVSNEALSQFFKSFPKTKCVVLNACFSMEQADSISQSVSYVIGMPNEVSDNAALCFATGFYGALASGKNIEEAYRIGSGCMLVSGVPEDLLPSILPENEVKQFSDGKLSDGIRATISIAIEPIKDLLSPFFYFVFRQLIPQVNSYASSSTQNVLAVCGVQLRSNIQKKIWLQWISASTSSFLLGALLSPNQYEHLGIVLFFAALLVTPLLQWQILKDWIFPTSRLTWWFATTFAWIIGVITGVLLYPNPRDIAEVGFMLLVGLMTGGIFTGLFQGLILAKSQLKINVLKWTLVNAFGMLFGSIIGIVPTVLFIAESIPGEHWDDVVIMILLGITYGSITGAALLPRIDAYSNEKFTQISLLGLITNITRKLVSTIMRLGTVILGCLKVAVKSVQRLIQYIASQNRLNSIVDNVGKVMSNWGEFLSKHLVEQDMKIKNSQDVSENTSTTIEENTSTSEYELHEEHDIKLEKQNGLIADTITLGEIETEKTRSANNEGNRVSF